MDQYSFPHNDLPILMDRMDSVESVSVGVFVGSGSRNETAENQGVAHYLEHMAFKGTERRSAEEISREIEEVGGQMNAFTGREMTAYVIKVLREHLPLAMDILGDILLHSTFTEEEMERERGVIIQEMGMRDDYPSLKVSENLERVLYPNQSMGRKIVGTADTVKNMTPEHLKAFMAEQYAANNMLVSAAGSFAVGTLIDLCQEHLGSLKQRICPRAPVPVYHVGKILEHRELEQAQVAMAWEGFCSSDPSYWAAQVLGIVMGGGMSSRLIQEIRERRGLAYDIGSGHCAQIDSGVFMVHAGTDPAKADELIQVVEAELAKTDITEAEVLKAKTGINAALRMAREDTMSRMQIAAQDFLHWDRRVPLQETLGKIERVTLGQVLEAQANIVRPEKRSLSILSPAVERSDG